MGCVSCAAVRALLAAASVCPPGISRASSASWACIDLSSYHTLCKSAHALCFCDLWVPGPCLATQHSTVCPTDSTRCAASACAVTTCYYCPVTVCKLQMVYLNSLLLLCPAFRAHSRQQRDHTAQQAARAMHSLFPAKTGLSTAILQILGSKAPHQGATGCLQWLASRIHAGGSTAADESGGTRKLNPPTERHRKEP